MKKILILIFAFFASVAYSQQVGIKDYYFINPVALETFHLENVEVAWPDGSLFARADIYIVPGFPDRLHIDMNNRRYEIMKEGVHYPATGVYEDWYVDYIPIGDYDRSYLRIVYAFYRIGMSYGSISKLYVRTEMFSGWAPK